MVFYLVIFSTVWPIHPALEIVVPFTASVDEVGSPFGVFVVSLWSIEVSVAVSTKVIA